LSRDESFAIGVSEKYLARRPATLMEVDEAASAKRITDAPPVKVPTSRRRRFSALLRRSINQP
jgi:hypothetical protein